MGIKSMIFKFALRKLAPKLGQALLGTTQRSKYARGYFPAYGYSRKPKGLFGLLKKVFKKVF